MKPEPIKMALRLHRPTLLTGDLSRSFDLYCNILGFEVCFIKEKAGQETPAYKYFNVDPSLYEITKFATLDLDLPGVEKQQRVFGLIEIRRRVSEDEELTNIAPVEFYNENQIRSTSIVIQVPDVLEMNTLLKEKGYKTFEPEPPTPTPEGKFYTEMSFLDSDGHLVVLYHIR